MTAQEFIDSLRQEGFDDADIRAAACDGETLARYGVTDADTAEDIVRLLDEEEELIQRIACGISPQMRWALGLAG